MAGKVVPIPSEFCPVFVEGILCAMWGGLERQLGAFCATGQVDITGGGRHDRPGIQLIHNNRVRAFHEAAACAAAPSQGLGHCGTIRISSQTSHFFPRKR